MNSLLGTKHRVKKRNVDWKRQSEKYKVASPMNKLVNSSSNDTQAGFRELVAKDRDKLKETTTSQQYGTKKTMLKMHAINLYPFWKDYRNVFLSNLLRASVSNLKDYNVLILNWLFALGGLYLSFTSGYLETYLTIQFGYTGVDLLLAEFSKNEATNLLVGQNLDPYLKHTRTN
jgi:hypothetical protein